MLLAGREHQVHGRRLLQHHPHGSDVVRRITPVPLRVEVTEVDRVLTAGGDAGYGARDLARYKRLAPAWRFVVEQDAVGREHAVRLAIVDDDPVGEDLRDAVRTTRVERGLFVLGRRCAPKQLRRRRLVQANGRITVRYGFEQPQRAQRIHVARVLGSLEAHLDVALGGEVVDLARPYFIDEARQE